MRRLITIAAGLLSVALFLSIGSAAQAAPSGTFFALSQVSGDFFQLVTVDPSTGAISAVGGGISRTVSGDTSALDAAGNRYFIVGSLFLGGPRHSFTVDTQTGAVLTTSPPLAGNLSGVEFEETPEVEIDIKPGSDPNAINPAARGSIPVAILTTGTFDALTVSPSTVQFGPAGASIAHRSGHLKDVDKDGDLDLVLHFRTQESGIQCGDTEAFLTGETFDGQPIQGSDSIVTVGCR